MDKLKVFINKFHYGELEGCPLCLFFLRVILGFVSVFYLAVIKIKNSLYHLNILKEKKVEPFVICIGNLTTGGVGKTPLTIEIANHLSALGKKVAVISRGYGAKLNNKKINVIKDYDGIKYTDGAICGDEALLIAQNSEGAVVLTCANRVLAANYAKDNFDTEIVILDDGFSNRKIKKDFTILAIDSKKQFGNKQVLPMGPLREPVSEMKRADFIVVINKDNNKYNKLFKNIENYTVCNISPNNYYNIKDNSSFHPDGQKAGAFCAIGQPKQFYQYIHKDFNLVYTKSFADHFSYNIEALKKIVKESGARTFITTQKDEVKIKELIKSFNEVGFLALRLALKFEDDKLFECLENEIKKYEIERNIHC